MKFGFYKKYIFWFLLVFFLEVCITVFVQDRFIRPFVGDALVIWLIYSFVRMFCEGGKTILIVLSVFGFACMVEVGQYFDLASILGWGDSNLARIILGSTFDWIDMIAYAAGTLPLILIVLLKKKCTAE